jgi:hypothetical protein
MPDHGIMPCLNPCLIESRAVQPTTPPPPLFRLDKPTTAHPTPRPPTAVPLQDYDCMSEALAWRLLEAVSLDEERFTAVARLCFGEGSGF